MATRRKTAAQDAPQTIEEATQAVVRYVEIDTGLTKLSEDAEAAIAKIRGARDEMSKPLEQELKAILFRMRTWWAVASEAMTDGKRKSIDLAGCLLGTRMSPPKIKTVQTEALAIAALELGGLKQFVSYAPSLDKPAIKKALSDPKTEAEKNTAALLTAIGLSIVQKEEFFIDRPEPLPAAETVIEQAAA